MALSILQLSVRRSKKLLEKNVVAVHFVKSVNFNNNVRNLNDICICTPFACSLVKEHETNVREYSKHVKHQNKAKESFETDSDSDAEFEVLGNRGQSAFWRRKIRTFHNLLDVNKDGVISFDDFQLLADKFVSLGHLSEENSKEFRNVIKTLWEKQWGEITPYNLVTVEKYLEDMHHVLNDKDLSKKSHSFLPYLFKAVDKDGSGEITVEEFKLFFTCLGLKDSDAQIAFNSIDSNGDGKITMKEFVKHGRDFFFTEDDTRISKYFWGPLVQ